MTARVELVDVSEILGSVVGSVVDEKLVEQVQGDAFEHEVFVSVCVVVFQPAVVVDGVANVVDAEVLHVQELDFLDSDLFVGELVISDALEEIADGLVTVHVNVIFVFRFLLDVEPSQGSVGAFDLKEERVDDDVGGLRDGADTVEDGLASVPSGVCGVHNSNVDFVVDEVIG